jgi:hypothetical protein
MRNTVFRQEYTHEYLSCGGTFPWYHGLAYQRYDRMTYVMYLIPFNLFARWWLNFLRYAKGPGAWDRLLQDAYNRGREDGIKIEQARTAYASERIEKLVNKLSRI